MGGGGCEGEAVPLLMAATIIRSWGELEGFECSDGADVLVGSTRDHAHRSSIHQTGEHASGWDTIYLGGVLCSGELAAWRMPKGGPKGTVV